MHGPTKMARTSCTAKVRSCSTRPHIAKFTRIRSTFQRARGHGNAICKNPESDSSPWDVRDVDGAGVHGRDSPDVASPSPRFGRPMPSTCPRSGGGKSDSDSGSSEIAFQWSRARWNVGQILVNFAVWGLVLQLLAFAVQLVPVVFVGPWIWTPNFEDLPQGCRSQIEGVTQDYPCHSGQPAEASQI